MFDYLGFDLDVFFLEKFDNLTLFSLSNYFN